MHHKYHRLQQCNQCQQNNYVLILTFQLFHCILLWMHLPVVCGRIHCCVSCAFGPEYVLHLSLKGSADPGSVMIHHKCPEFFYMFLKRPPASQNPGMCFHRQHYHDRQDNHHRFQILDQTQSYSLKRFLLQWQAVFHLFRQEQKPTLRAAAA